MEDYPFSARRGESYYLHLGVWRANARLSKKPIWLCCCQTLWSWTREPWTMDHGTFSNRTQVWTEEEAKVNQLEDRAERQLEARGEEIALLELDRREQYLTLQGQQI